RLYEPLKVARRGALALKSDGQPIERIFGELMRAVYISAHECSFGGIEHELPDERRFLLNAGMGGGEVKDRARLIVAVAFRRRLGREPDGRHPSVGILSLRKHDGGLLGIGGGRFESFPAKHQLAS